MDTPDRLFYEKKLWDEGYERVMGLDEVGRGCLSGPVVAAGVILAPGTSLTGIRDSKKMTLGDRLQATTRIKEQALFWSVQECSPAVIDRINILQASLKAMQKCTEAPHAEPEFLLIDGNRYGSTIFPYKTIIGGDDASLSIAAASILAKVHRDTLMKKLHSTYPHYGWDTNVGYPTKKHYSGLENHGITKHHRRSFNLRTAKLWDDTQS